MRASSVHILLQQVGAQLLVTLLAAASGMAVLWATKALEGKWFIAFVAGLSVFGAALASGRFERFLLGLLFLVIPVNVDIHFTLGTPRELLYYLSKGTQRLGFSAIDLILCCLYAAWIARLLVERRVSRRVWPAGATALACLIGWAALSLINARQPWLSFVLLADFVKAFLLFFYLANHIKTREDLWLVARCLIAGLILESLIACAQHLAGSNLGLQALGERRAPKEFVMGGEKMFRIGGTLGHPNSLGGYLATVLPVVWAIMMARLRLAWRLVVAAASVLGTGVLVLTLSRSAWLGAAVAAVALGGWWMGHDRRHSRLLPLLGFVAILVVTLTAFAPLIVGRWVEDDRGSATSRIPQMRIAWSIIQDHPIVGIGLNNYDTISHMHKVYIADSSTRALLSRQAIAIHTHNVFLLLAVEIGLMGLFFVGWFLWVVARRAWRRITTTPDELPRLILMGMALGLFARLWHDATHTGHLTTNIFFWIYPAILVARGPRANG